jgi:23S rRNA (uracil1939-C5)-methyltransferase
MKIGTEHTVSIDKMVFHGSGMGDINGFKVFVQGAVPGDTVLCRIVQKKRRFAKASIVSFKNLSPLRGPTKCSHFPSCGGCQLMDIEYKKQLAIKSEILYDCFKQTLPHICEKIDPIVPSLSPFFYRNKMEFSFGKNNEKIFIGLKERGRYNKVIPISDCKLQDQQTNQILQTIEKFCNDHALSAWDYDEHNGCLRQLMLRHSKTKNEWMILLTTSNDISHIIDKFSDIVTTEHKNVVSIFYQINNNQGDSVIEKNIHHIYGKKTLTEQLGKTSYEISAKSFFQTNTKQADLLYQIIVNLAELSTSDILLDLYCGTGSIGLFCAPYVKEIIGIEEVPEAIEDAKRNALINKIRNTTFFCGRVKNILKFEKFSPNCIVIDPPRAGIVPKALKRIIDINCKKIVYVSCNPVTLSRDLVEFETAGYSINKIIPVDMFPNTFHIETVVQLTKQETFN